MHGLHGRSHITLDLSIVSDYKLTTAPPIKSIDENVKPSMVRHHSKSGDGQIVQAAWLYHPLPLPPPRRRPTVPSQAPPRKPRPQPRLRPPCK